VALSIWKRRFNDERKSGSDSRKTGPKRPEYSAITKLDQENATQYLSGAVFELYDTTYNNGVFTKTGEPLGREETSDNNKGTITFGGTDNISLKYNHVYCLVEVTAPTGYAISTEPLYVGIFRSVSQDGNTLYPKDWTQDEFSDSSKKATTDNSWMPDVINAWNNIVIDYTNSAFKYAWYNDKTKILVNKIFQDENGESIDFPDGTYKFGLYSGNKLIQTLSIQKTDGKTSYFLTVGNNTTDVDEPKFIGYDETKSYDVYELNDDNNPISNNRIIYTNKKQYTVSYQRDISSQTVNVINREYSIPITGLHVSRNTSYMIGTVILAGVFIAYILWMRKRRT
jgi:hypothetical protein